MSPEEAVSRVEWWGLNLAETQALGSTRDPAVGTYFNGDDVPAEQFTDPNGPRIWAIRIPALLRGAGQSEPRANPIFELVQAEMLRREGRCAQE